ncbi:unnamed protein product [Trichogramma brassicae]|uniref:EGF domain-specific O-linked N-acetylglucosamine transferase n=1 Tax=Trichogramma brassicae TaxID=86971 RepID=A0A6H5I785_9HYME|nr:unnamed protein product [Trichogramma brassicae]
MLLELWPGARAKAKAFYVRAHTYSTADSYILFDKLMILPDIASIYQVYARRCVQRAAGCMDSRGATGVGVSDPCEDAKHFSWTRGVELNRYISKMIHTYSIKTTSWSENEREASGKQARSLTGKYVSKEAFVLIVMLQKSHKTINEKFIMFRNHSALQKMITTRGKNVRLCPFNFLGLIVITFPVILDDFPYQLIRSLSKCTHTTAAEKKIQPQLSLGALKNDLNVSQSIFFFGLHPESPLIDKRPIFTLVIPKKLLLDFDTPSLAAQEHIRYEQIKKCKPTRIHGTPSIMYEKISVFSGTSKSLRIAQSITMYFIIRLDKDKLNANADHISPLQSWGPELRNFRKLARKPIPSGDCDVVIEKPTYILKIDAAVNMYHHFCDFFNLYASLHVNLTHPNAFNTDNNIMIWESFNYRSSFQDTFQAFTNNPLWDLRTFKGETVCFKNVVFPLLPRMIFGLFYNTPLIYGCENSGLFAAFSDFILYRLQVPLHERKNTKIRVTLLSRETQYRNILNEDALVEALKAKPEYDVQRVVYNKNIPFKKQLEITRNSDIFIGMHGAGLTHFLFLPEWAAGFELYNCEDASCYKDLARLKGIKYITWQDKSKLTEVDPVTKNF